MVSGASGVPGGVVPRLVDVEQDLRLAPGSVTLLSQLEVEDIARGNPRRGSPATTDYVEVFVVKNN